MHEQHTKVLVDNLKASISLNQMNWAMLSGAVCFCVLEAAEKIPGPEVMLCGCRPWFALHGRLPAESWGVPAPSCVVQRKLLG